MTAFAMGVVEYFQHRRATTWKMLVRFVFGTFLGALVLLLILTYSGVPIV
jgi:hypothetical protein